MLQNAMIAARARRQPSSEELRHTARWLNHRFAALTAPTPPSTATRQQRANHQALSRVADGDLRAIAHLMALLRTPPDQLNHAELQRLIWSDPVSWAIADSLANAPEHAEPPGDVGEPTIEGLVQAAAARAATQHRVAMERVGKEQRTSIGRGAQFAHHVIAAYGELTRLPVRFSRRAATAAGGTAENRPAGPLIRFMERFYRDLHAAAQTAGITLATEFTAPAPETLAAYARFYRKRHVRPY